MLRNELTTSHSLNDGEMSIFEENCRRTYNEMRYEMITEESDSESHYWGDDEDLKDAAYLRGLPDEYSRKSIVYS